MRQHVLSHLPELDTTTKEVTNMFRALTDELLDLTATQQGFRRAYLAEYRIILCCTCTVKFQ
jgi:hypothetical protein